MITVTKLFLALAAVFLSAPTLAAQYSCLYTDKETGKDVRVTIEAATHAEAVYKVEQKSRGRMGCTSVAASADVFLSDGRFQNNPRLRPYLPPDVRLKSIAGFRCEPSGAFSPDNAPMSGTCYEAVSASTKSSYLIRISATCTQYQDPQTFRQVWKLEGGSLESRKKWVSFASPQCPAEEGYVSPEAKEFAKNRQPFVDVAQSTSVTPEATTVSQPQTGPSNPQAPSNPIEDAVKKGLDVLKGLGR